ncbi:ATP-binding protein [Paenibacillus dendritiformis]
MAILREKFAAGTVSRFREKLRKVDLLILDEMGYMPFSQTGANRMIHFLCKN